MSSTRASRRAVLTSAAAVMTGALLLTACGSDDDSSVAADSSTSATRTITDAQGRKVKVPAEPQKVVALSEPTLDAALALGIEPVGATAGRGQTGVSTYLAGKASKAQV